METVLEVLRLALDGLLKTGGISEAAHKQAHDSLDGVTAQPEPAKPETQPWTEPAPDPAGPPAVRPEPGTEGTGFGG
jgi:hypothetical protein